MATKWLQTDQNNSGICGAAGIRKVQYMKLHGYTKDENDKLYAGLERTSRLEVEDEHGGKYSCRSMSRGC